MPRSFVQAQCYMVLSLLVGRGVGVCVWGGGVVVERNLGGQAFKIVKKKNGRLVSRLQNIPLHFLLHIFSKCFLKKLGGGCFPLLPAPALIPLQRMHIGL